MLGLNNKVAELQARYEIARNKTLQWEAIVTKIKTASVHMVQELHEVDQSIRNIYLNMCRRKEVEPELGRDDVEGQLLFIKGTMLELKRITSIAKRQAAKQKVGMYKCLVLLKPNNFSFYFRKHNNGAVQLQHIKFLHL